MDALTVVLTASGIVDTTPGAVNHVALAIADVLDHRVDSNVFLESNSFSCEPPTGACCDRATGTCGEDVLEEDCPAEWYAGLDCTHVHPPCESPRMLVLLDRTGSMNELRTTGNTRCVDALEIAIDDVTQFFISNSGGRVAVWTFNNTEPTPLTDGFVDEAAALTALMDPSVATCDYSTPLAESMCEGADALDAELADPAVGDLILAVSSDGLENNSDGYCAGPDSIGGTDCGEYDAGSWQQNVCDRLIGSAIVMVRYWGSLLPAGDGPSIDPETGEPLGAGVPDLVFFESLAEATGGGFVFEDDNGPTSDDLGACCDPIGRCREGLTDATCTALGGSPLPPGSSCLQVACFPDPVLIPAASTWGLSVLGLSVLTLGTMLLRRREPERQ